MASQGMPHDLVLGPILKLSQWSRGQVHSPKNLIYSNRGQVDLDPSRRHKIGPSIYLEVSIKFSHHAQVALQGIDKDELHMELFDPLHDLGELLS